jgi:DeoR/GlpR family transcriptional regulator of sugar metabolism
MRKKDRIDLILRVLQENSHGMNSSYIHKLVEVYEGGIVQYETIRGYLYELQNEGKIERIGKKTWILKV